MTERKCVECGGNLVRQRYLKITAIGAYRASDRSKELLVCCDCNEPLIDFDTLEGYERRAVRAVLCDAPKAGEKITGDVVRYARRCIGLSQGELAKLLDVSPETVSRYETGRLPVTTPIALAIADIVNRFEADEQVALEKEAE